MNISGNCNGFKAGFNKINPALIACNQNTAYTPLTNGFLQSSILPSLLKVAFPKFSAATKH
jgi:hypothetical protein